MKTTSEAEPFRPQAQKGNKNKYTPGRNWFGDKEYDPACLLTLLQLSSEEWHLARISLAGWYIVRKCVCASERVLQTGGEKNQANIVTHRRNNTFILSHRYSDMRMQVLYNNHNMVIYSTAITARLQA